MKMTYKTKTRKNAGSMLTVIPSAITNLLDIESGDVMVWTVNITPKGAELSVKPMKE